MSRGVLLLRAGVLRALEIEFEGDMSAAEVEQRFGRPVDEALALLCAVDDDIPAARAKAVETLMRRTELDAPDIGGVLAWAVRRGAAGTVADRAAEAVLRFDEMLAAFD